MKHIILLCATLLFCVAANAQKLSRAQAISDIDTMAYYITAIHPDPFTVVPERYFRADIERMKTSLADSITVLDLYLRLAPIVAALGDGHTSLFSNRSVLRQLGDGGYFPLPLEVDPHTKIMTSGGRKIEKINNISAHEIVEKIVATQSGESIAFRVFRVNNWPIMASLILQNNIYSINFSDGEIIKMHGINYEKSRALTPSESNNRPSYSYRIIEDKNAALLYYNACEGDNFRPFLDAMFAEIKDKNITNLIIDVRENRGGSSAVNDELLQYISPGSFNQFGRVKKRLSEPWRKFHIYSDHPYREGIIEDLGEMAYKDTIVVTPRLDLRPLRENPLRFTGNVYVLTSLRTFSSATSFTWAFQYYNMGKIAGEETGGYIVCFGDIIPIVLPYSQLRGYVSWKEFYGIGATEADRRPVRPDIPVPASQALEYVLEKLVK